MMKRGEVWWINFDPFIGGEIRIAEIPSLSDKKTTVDITGPSEDRP